MAGEPKHHHGKEAVFPPQEIETAEASARQEEGPLPLNDNDSAPSGKSQAQKVSSKELDALAQKQILKDEIDGRYKILANKPIPALSTEFAEAYEVEDRKDAENTSLYCLVFIHSFQPRVRVINELKNLNLPNFLTPVAVGVMLFSGTGECQFSVIMPKPPQKTLAEFVQENGKIPEDVINSLVVAPLTSILGVTENLNIVHGRINLHNLYITDKKQIVLGECISEPPGFSQPSLYEPVERARVMPIGKGEGETSIDYYALGIVAFCLQKGKDMTEQLNNDEMLEAKLMNGSFNALVQKIVLSPSMMDLYRGLLNDKASMRWQSAQLRDWLKGKNFNLVRIPPTVEASRSIYFNEVQYFNRSSLCHALYRHWGSARTFLRDDKLVKWIEGSVGDPEMAEQLRYIQKATSTGNMKNPVFDANDELVARTLLVLDPSGLLRIKNLSANIDALGNLIAYDFGKKMTSNTLLLATFLKRNIGTAKESTLSNDDKKQNTFLKNMYTFLTCPGVGFGMERCLYQLNPYLPCQSPLIKDHYVLTLKQLLEVLDEKATDAEEYLFDTHIAAFITYKTGLSSEYAIKSLSRYPKIKASPVIQALALLTLAQRESGIKKLKNLTAAMGKYIAGVSEFINGKKYKEEFTNDITKIAKEGNFTLLYNYVAEAQVFAKDASGFNEARKRYLDYSNQLKKLNKQSSIANLGYHYGLRLAVLIAYFLCSAVFFFLLSRGE